jgi:hypothetical protein
MFAGSRLSSPKLLGNKYTANPISNQITIHLGDKSAYKGPSASVRLAAVYHCQGPETTTLRSYSHLANQLLDLAC